MSTLMLVDLAPELVAEVEPGDDVELWWTANHQSSMQRVRGGWPTVRLLIGSVDGAGWPWTTIENRTDQTCRWVQVLGTPDSMTLEIGGDGYVYRVGHAKQGRGSRVPMPQECQWWVPAIWDNQVLTADQAYQTAKRYLSCGLLAQACSLEEITYLEHRLR